MSAPEYSQVKHIDYLKQIITLGLYFPLFYNSDDRSILILVLRYKSQKRTSFQFLSEYFSFSMAMNTVFAIKVNCLKYILS